jgi:hypothetical protein
MSRLAARKISGIYSACPEVAAGNRKSCFRGPDHPVHGLASAITATPENEPPTCNTSEPPIGIEPMTYALRVRRSDRLS